MRSRRVHGHGAVPLVGEPVKLATGGANGVALASVELCAFSPATLVDETTK